MEIAILTIYGLMLAFIFCYSLIQGRLIVLYLRSKQRMQDLPEVSDWPKVTVQLPLYNEMYVVERLIDAIVQLDYPQDRLEIQILDDSSDETVNIVKEKVEYWQNQGFNIKQVIREERVGFKAGALAYATKFAEGEYIAIFDADFVPSKDFLKRTIPHFMDSQIGVVQTKWGHINKDFSLLTKLQAFGLDAHFTVEQSGRNEGGHFINFNGTAGVWRKECIYDAGGWQSDTLTEDLDLSYRAQMKGWKFKYLEDLTSPAELPVAMNALKSQQYRWTKGAAETAKKNLKQLWACKDIPMGTKIHGVFHLLNSSVFISIIGTALLSIPALLIKHTDAYSYLRPFYLIASFLLVSLLILGTFYWVSLSGQHKGYKRFTYFITTFPVFLSVSMGLSLHNAKAVLEGIIGKKSAFIRTPKFNIISSSDQWKSNQYLVSSISGLTFLELFMGAYACYGIYLAFHLNDFGLFPFHLLLSFGYFYVAWFSIKHSVQGKQ